MKTICMFTLWKRLLDLFCMLHLFTPHLHKVYDPPDRYVLTPAVVINCLRNKPPQMSSACKIDTNIWWNHNGECQVCQHHFWHISSFITIQRLKRVSLNFTLDCWNHLKECCRKQTQFSRKDIVLIKEIVHTFRSGPWGPELPGQKVTIVTLT